MSEENKDLEPVEEPKEEKTEEQKQSGSTQTNSFFDTPDHTAEFDAEDIEKNKIMALLAYLSWLVLVPLIAAKDSKFARFHCNQGIVLAIVEIIVWVVFGILSSVVPVVWWIFSILNSVLSLCCLGLAILGIINAVNGKAKELPIIGKFRLFK